MTQPPIKTVLTGMRATGFLHLGHFVGALKQWLEVQSHHDKVKFFLLADVQALTTHADNPQLIKKSVIDVVLDWISVGLNPELEDVHFVLQSGVPSRFEISQYLSMIATLSEIERNPTIKSELATLRRPTLGFLSYVLDQVADIVMVSPPNVAGNLLLVPVGADQIPHLEYAREIARRFNSLYSCNVLMECQPQVGEIGRLVGTDGNSKMSKSSNNAINLTDTPQEVADKIKAMHTDPNRLRWTDPGTEEGLKTHAPLQYHIAFNPNRQQVDEMVTAYLNGGIKDSDIKKQLGFVMHEFLQPIRERRFQAEQEANVMDIIRQGTLVATRYSDQVRDEMKDAMHLFRL